MPFCLVWNNNNASSFNTIHTSHTVLPDLPDVPFFLIPDSLEHGRDLTQLAYFFTSKKIKDKKNKIYLPNPVYSYVNAFHTSSSNFSKEQQSLYKEQRKEEKKRLKTMRQISPEQRLRYQAECMAADIISKLPKPVNQKPCVILAISWESTKALLIAEYLMDFGFQAPLIYLIDSTSHEYAQRVLTQNQEFATKEILELINRAAALCSLKAVDYLDVKQFSGVDIDKLDFKCRFDPIMACILERNNLYKYRLKEVVESILEKNDSCPITPLVDKQDNFEKYVNIIQNNLCNLINHPASDCSFTKNIRLLFTQEMLSNFPAEKNLQTENNFGWANHIARINLTNDQNEIVYSSNKDLLLGADHVQLLARSIRTIYNELTLPNEVNSACEHTAEVKRVCEKLKSGEIAMDEAEIKKMEEALLDLQSIKMPFARKPINIRQVVRTSQHHAEAVDVITDNVDSPGDEMYWSLKRKSLVSSSDTENDSNQLSSAEKTPKTPSSLLLTRVVQNSKHGTFFRSASPSSSNNSSLNNSGEEDPSKKTKTNLTVS